jgi:glycosyltransferase involved in cell wall biosynthesis
LSRYLVEQGVDVSVFTTNALDLEAFWTTRGRTLAPGLTQEHGVSVRRYPLWRAPEHRRVLKVLSQIPVRTWQCLTLSCNPIAWDMWRDAGRAQQRFDLVHASAFPYGWPLVCALRLARRLGVPFVLTPFVHTGDPEDASDRTRRAYTSPALLSLVNAADKVFVQSEVEHEVLRNHGVPDGKLILQGMGVDFDSCIGGNRNRARSRWGVKPDEVVVGHLANLSGEKGSVDLLRASQLAWQQGGRFRVVLAGPDMPNFRRFWDRFPAAERVHRLGVLSEEEKRDFFAGIDVFALPSRSDSFGIVLLEAWANEVPNVGYRAGGIAGVIRHGEDGLLVRCGDITGLAETLTRLARDAELRRRLGTTGCERLPYDFCWDDKLSLVRDVYEELTSRVMASVAA